MTVCCAVIVAVRLGFQQSSIEQESAVSEYFLMKCLVLHLRKFVFCFSLRFVIEPGLGEAPSWALLAVCRFLLRANLAVEWCVMGTC